MQYNGSRIFRYNLDN